MKQKKSLKIIQLSDTHLSKDNACIFNINTNNTFKNLIIKMQPDLIDADAIFLTGDISQDESLDSYQLLFNSLNNFTKNIFWIPGNHDSLDNMRYVFNKNKNYLYTKTLTTNYWDFIFLNTKYKEFDEGLLDEDELSFLKSQLNKKTRKRTALVMHHHPIEVNTPLIDNFILKNKEQFWDIVNSKIDLIIGGHVHGDYAIQYSNISIELAPATCFQFKKGATNLDIDSRIGYKVYHFLSNDYVVETKLWGN